MLSALCGGSALIPAGVDYELRFSQDRSAENCLEEADVGNWPRDICMILSILGLLFLMPYRYYYLRWQRHIPMTFRELPSLSKMTIMQVFEMKKKATVKE